MGSHKLALQIQSTVELFNSNVIFSKVVEMIQKNNLSVAGDRRKHGHHHKQKIQKIEGNKICGAEQYIIVRAENNDGMMLYDSQSQRNCLHASGQSKMPDEKLQ